jgi:hypothetical protein
LLFNPRKSQAILILNYVVDMVLPSLFLGIREDISWCDAVTDLEVVIDGRLRFDRQVTKVCSRVYVLVLPEFFKNKNFVKGKSPSYVLINFVTFSNCFIKMSIMNIG